MAAGTKFKLVVEGERCCKAVEVDGNCVATLGVRYIHIFEVRGSVHRNSM